MACDARLAAGKFSNCNVWHGGDNVPAAAIYFLADAVCAPPVLLCACLICLSLATEIYCLRVELERGSVNHFKFSGTHGNVQLRRHLVYPYGRMGSL